MFMTNDNLNHFQSYNNRYNYIVLRTYERNQIYYNTYEIILLNQSTCRLSIIKINCTKNVYNAETNVYIYIFLNKNRLLIVDLPKQDVLNSYKFNNLTI